SRLDRTLAGEWEEPYNFQSNDSARHPVLRAFEPGPGFEDHPQNCAGALEAVRGAQASQAQGWWNIDGGHHQINSILSPMKTMKKTTRIGIVGCGYWGPNLIRNFRQTSDCQLAMVCDTSEQR